MRKLIGLLVVGFLVGCSEEGSVLSSSESVKDGVESSSSFVEKTLEERCSELGGILVRDEKGFVVDRHFNSELEGCLVR